MNECKANDEWMFKNTAGNLRTKPKRYTRGNFWAS